MKISFSRKAYYLIGLFYFFTCFFYGQNQKKSDSLIMLYESGTFQGDELDLLKNIVNDETDPKRVLEFSDLLIKKAIIDSSFEFLHSGYFQKGNALARTGENSAALEAYFKSLSYANRINDQTGVGGLMIAIAGAYTSMEDTKNAIRYYKSGIHLLRTVNDSIKIATSLLNIGDLYITIGKLDSALIYTSESLIIFNKVNFPIGRAYGMGNSGMIYAEQGKDKLAETNIQEAIEILEDSNDRITEICQSFQGEKNDTCA
jgi:adenylate cyclase